MTKDDFKADTRYTLTVRDASGRLTPLNLYVYRTYGDFMVARETSGPGLVRKIAYADVVKIVHEHAIEPADRYFLPAQLLEEKNWRDRSVMQHYASAPGRGK